MTITLEPDVERLVRRHAAEAGYGDVHQYVRDQLAGKEPNGSGAGQTEAEAEEAVGRLRGSATRRITFEAIAAETRSEV